MVVNSVTGMGMLPQCYIESAAVQRRRHVSNAHHTNKLNIHRQQHRRRQQNDENALYKHTEFRLLRIIKGNSEGLNYVKATTVKKV
jgi:hypothetical protein